MEVFKFSKTWPTRFHEFQSVLSWSDRITPASKVKQEWSYFIQLTIEPVGWQALWKIPRVICEDLEIRYPTVVYGNVEQVIFNELKAVFTIQAVEDEDINLQETQEVNLEDLYPTKIQKNECNIERTAECIESLRFFYKNLWMPWDYEDDDDIDWTKKHLESRMQFFYDLQKHIKITLANHIRNLLREAKFINEKIQYLEMDFSDDEEIEKSVAKTNVTDLMKLHLQLKKLKYEIELLENPKMRIVYEEMNSQTSNQFQNISVFLVIKPCTIVVQQKILNTIKKFINDDIIYQNLPSLQEALKSFSPKCQIYLTPEIHNINFFEYLNNGGVIYGLHTKDDNGTPDVIVTSTGEANVLFIFDGDFTIKNITLNCKNVRTGIIVQSGTVKIENCCFIGEKDTSNKQAIQITGNSNLILENCRLENFSTGIKACNNANISLNNTEICNCSTGIEIKKAKINCQNVKISSCKFSAISLEIQDQNLGNVLIANNINEIIGLDIPWEGTCYFENNTKNIFIKNCKQKSFEQQLDDNSCDEFSVNIADD